MKKYLVTCLVFLAAYPATAQFQPKHDIVKFHMLHLFGSTFKGSYEHFNANFNRSVVIKAAYTGSNINTPRSGIEGELQYRLYAVQSFSSGAEKKESYYHGFYFAPYIGYRYIEREESVFLPGPNWGDPVEYATYINSYRFGTNIGYQFTIFNNIYFDASMGGGVKLGSTKYSPSAPDRDFNFGWPEDQGVIWPGYTGVYPRFDFSVGFGF